MFTDPSKMVITADSLREIVADWLNRKLCGVDVKVTDVFLDSEGDEVTLLIETVKQPKK